MEENKRPRLLRKFYSKLFTSIGIFIVGIYSLIHISDAPYYLISFLNCLILFVYFTEGIGRVRKRLNGKWD
jgi:hypothetical protein